MARGTKPSSPPPRPKKLIANRGDPDPLEGKLPPLPPGLKPEQLDIINGWSTDDRARWVKHMHQRRLERCREDFLTFGEYVGRDEETQEPIKQGRIHRRIHSILDQHPEVVVFSHIESGKGLPLDTLLPTPTGWTTMAALREGDVILAGDGTPTRVTFTTETHYGRPCFRIEFDDGASLISDDVHRWKVQSMDDRRLLRESPPSVGTPGGCACGCGKPVSKGKRFAHGHHARKPRTGEWRVLNTTELLSAGLLRRAGTKDKEGNYTHQYRWRMPLPGVAERAHQTLPIDPYWLGAWLGDGTSANGDLTMHGDDRQIGEECERVEGKARWSADKRNANVFRVSFPQMQPRLRELGVLGHKHIPEIYLRGSIEQRKALLAGLIDTDGTVGKRGGVCFDNTNERLTKGVLELARSLGLKAHLRSKPVKSPIDGRYLGLCFTVSFFAPFVVFRLERKAKKQKATRQGRTTYRSVAAIVPVESVPTRCITVDSSDHTFLAGRDYVVTHNTTSVAILRLIWEIGRCPTIRAGVLSSNETNAGDRLSRAAAYMEESPEYKEVFPHIVKSQRRGERWVPNEEITVDRQLGPQHPTVRAIGLHNSILSWRCDLLIGDDILEFKNVVSKHERDKVMKWFEKTIIGRLVRNSRAWILGVPHHKEDLLHRLIERGFKGFRIPVREPDGTLNSPERWDHERIEKKKIFLGPSEAARQLEPLVARDDSQAKFKEDWVTQAMRLGLGLGYYHTIDDLPQDEWEDGSIVVTGVDLAVSKRDSAGDTALVTILVTPDKRRRILDVWGGKLSGPEIARKAIEVSYRYNSQLVVESVAAQRFICQLINEIDPDVPVIPFETRKQNKWDPAYGVESIGSEMAANRWVIPNNDGQMPNDVFALLQDMLGFDPKGHTGDRLMACWMAREGARRLGQEGQGVFTSGVAGAAKTAAEDVVQIVVQEAETGSMADELFRLQTQRAS